MINRNRKKIIVSLVFVGFLLYGFAWFFGHGRIEIILPPGEKTIKINTESEELIYTTSEISFNKILTKNNYYITVISNENNSSMVAAKNVGGFLKSTKLDVQFIPEENRTFIGDNPASCKEIIDDILISFPCNGSLDGLKLHVKATSNVPTYTKNIRSLLRSDQNEFDAPTLGAIEGVINKGDSLEMLVYNQGQGSAYHGVYEVSIENNSPILKFVNSVENLPNSTVFKSFNTKEGLILVGSDYSQVYRGDDYSNLSRVYSTYEPDEGWSIVGLDIDSNDFLYVSTKEFQRVNSVTKEDQPTKITIVNDNQEPKTGILPGVTDVSFCGENICVLNSTGALKVLDRNFKELLSVSNVVEFKAYNEELLIVSDNSVQSIDPNSLVGYELFDFSGYVYESLSSSRGSIVVSVGYESKSSALLLGSSNNSRGYPDVDLKNLLVNAYEPIDSVSVYGNKVFISPNLGEREYIPSTGTYDYSNSTKIKAKNEIDQIISNSIQNSGDYQIKISGIIF